MQGLLLTTVRRKYSQPTSQPSQANQPANQPANPTNSCGIQPASKANSVSLRIRMTGSGGKNDNLQSSKGCEGGKFLRGTRAGLRVCDTIRGYKQTRLNFKDAMIILRSVARGNLG